MGRRLVLGGARLLSRAVAAVARGHEVVCAARGVSGAVPDGAKLLAVDRDTTGALEPLRDEAFDAVVDVARMALPWVRSALEGPVRLLAEPARAGWPSDHTWSDPRSLPLWLPGSHAGMPARDTAPAAAAGLHCRPIADTARAALGYERVLGVDRPRRAGLSPAEESAILVQLS